MSATWKQVGQNSVYRLYLQIQPNKLISYIGLFVNPFHDVESWVCMSQPYYIIQGSSDQHTPVCLCLGWKHCLSGEIWAASSAIHSRFFSFKRES